jgi:hypothetical protein
MQFSPVPPSYNPYLSSYFRDGIAPVSGGYIDRAGRLIYFRANSGSMKPFSEGLAAVHLTHENGFGYIDVSGKIAIGPCLWDHDGDLFAKGAAMVFLQNGTRGLIGRDGRWIIEPQSSEIFTGYDAGWTRMRRGNKLVLENIHSDVIFERVATEHIGRVRDGMFVNALYPDPSTGSDHFIGISEDGIVQFEFDSRSDLMGVAGWYSEGLMVFNGSHQFNYGFLDKKGHVKIEGKYKYAFPFHEGLAPVSLENADGWGFIDQDDIWQIPVHENWIIVDCFSEGAAAVCAAREIEISEKLAGFETNDRWGYIDRHGEWLLPPVFGEADIFREGFAHVAFGCSDREYTAEQIKHRWELTYSRDCYLDQAGTFIWPPRLAGRNIHEFIVPLPMYGVEGEALPQVIIPESSNWWCRRGM